MKKILIFILFNLLFHTGNAQPKMRLTPKDSILYNHPPDEVPTYRIHEDKEGKLYPIFKNLNGEFYIFKKSKNREYKQYLRVYDKN